MTIPAKSISTLLKDVYGWLILQVEQFTASRHWILKTFFLSIFFSIFFSGGIDFDFVKRGGYPEGYFQKIEHPLLDVSKLHPINSHESVLNFRMTVPVIFHLLGIHGYWSLPLLTIFAICSIILTSCIIGYQMTGDRVCACLIALEVASTYVGSFGFIICYDAVAIGQIALATLPRMPAWGRGILVFTAAFTDERAFIASGLLLVGYYFFPDLASKKSARFSKPDFLAILIAMMVYVLVRLALMKFAGIHSPTGGSGLGYLFVVNFGFLHPGLWFSLEGGWLFYILALGILVARRNIFPAATLLLASVIFFALTLMVGDVMRSTSYALPLLFISLNVVRQNETLPILRLFCLLAFLISAVGGNYNVYIGQITWFEPLSLYFIQLAGEDFYKHIYYLLPHSLHQH